MNWSLHRKGLLDHRDIESRIERSNNNGARDRFHFGIKEDVNIHRLTLLMSEFVLDRCSTKSDPRAALLEDGYAPERQEYHKQTVFQRNHYVFDQSVYAISLLMQSMKHD